MKENMKMQSISQEQYERMIGIAPWMTTDYIACAIGFFVVTGSLYLIWSLLARLFASNTKPEEKSDE